MKADMKRYGNVWPMVCTKENLKEAALHAMKGKPGLKYFLKNEERLLENLMNDLKNETYTLSPLKEFIVYEPKERIINYPKLYPDKVYQAAVMLIIKPLIVSKLTQDTYGSLEKRGIKGALSKMKKALKKNPDWYYVQTDVKKFYESIDHDILKMKIRRIFKDQKLLRFIDANIDRHDKGLAIGTWLNQYLANLFLSDFDHYIKEVIRVPYYFRYMDDMVVLVPGKEEANKVLGVIKGEMEKIKLTVKPTHRVAPVKIGIDFIGYKLFPGKTRLRRSIGFRFQRRFKRLIKKGLGDPEIKQKIASYWGWCKHGNCRGLVKKILGNKIELFKDMEFKRIGDIKAESNWFGLPRTARVSINDLMDKDIIVHAFLKTEIGGQDKIVVKYSTEDSPEEYHYFMTRSEVLLDRLTKDQEHMPFLATMRRKKYYYYE